MSLSNKELASILVEGNTLKQEEIEAALAKAKEASNSTDTISLWEALLAQEFLTDEEIGTVVANHFDLPFVNLD